MFIRAIAISLLSIAFSLLIASPTRAQSASAPSWSLEQDLKIGSPNDPNYALNSINDLTVGSDGRIYVAQFLNNSVSVFDSKGTFVKNIGRDGAGPGEFQRVDALGWKGDSLWIRDAALNRLSFFLPPGTFLHSISFREPVPGGSYGTLIPGTPMADGNLVAVPSAPARLLADGTISEMPTLLTNREGEIQKVLTTVSFEHEVAQINFDRGGTTGRQPFSDAMIWRPSADGKYLWIVDRSVANDAAEGIFIISRLGLSGDTLVSRRYRYTPKLMPSLLVDSVVGVHVRRIRNGPARGTPVRTVDNWVRDAFFLPEFQVPVSAMVAGSNGLLWVRREEPIGTAAIWNIFSEDGLLHATARTPADLEVMVASDEYVWGVRKDELDVPYIYRYRIIPS